MAVKVECPECEMLQTVKDEKIGERVRCKECGEPFTAKARKKAKPADDDDEDDLPRPKKKKKKKAESSGGLPGWLVGTVLGVVVFIGVLVLMISILPYGRNRNGGGNNATAPANNSTPTPMPNIPAGPHASIIDHIGQVFDRLNGALGSINDENSIRNATTTIRRESWNFSNLVSELSRAPQPSRSDLESFAQAEKRIEPTMKRFEQLGREIGGRLNNPGISPNAVQEFRNALGSIAQPAQDLDRIEKRYQSLAMRQ